jgi:hypothetical protein
MRAIPSRVESVVFSGWGNVATLYERGSVSWQCPSGAIERRAFQVVTSCQPLSPPTAPSPTVRPVIEFRSSSTVGGLNDAASVVQRFPVEGTTSVAFSVEPGLYYQFRLSSALPADHGVWFMSAALIYERQA